MLDSGATDRAPRGSGSVRPAHRVRSAVAGRLGDFALSAPLPAGTAAVDQDRDAHAGSGVGLVVKMAEENHELRRKLRERDYELEELQELREAAAALRSRRRPEHGLLQILRSGSPAGCLMDMAEMPHDLSSCQQRLRYLYASPLSLPMLDIDGELVALETACADCFCIQPQVASITSLGQAVLEPDLWIHITAHSARGGQCLVLEDEDSLGDQDRLLPSAGLQSYLQVGGGACCRFLFLSACESEQLAKVFFAGGVQNVVFCPTEVQDRRARRFACALYSGMAKLLPLRLAFMQASAAAKLGGDSAQYGFLSSQDLEYVHEPPSAFAVQRPRAPPTRRSLRRRVEDFVGRRDVIHCALSYLNSKRRFVLLHSEESLGRSASLREIAHLVTVPGRKFAGIGSCAFFSWDGAWRLACGGRSGCFRRARAGVGQTALGRRRSPDLGSQPQRPRRSTIRRLVQDYAS